MKNKIALIGPMASGKSTVGKVLAGLLQFDFIDSDSYIEQMLGLSIAKIFEQKGEAYFRKQEELALKELILKPNIVIATGGGIVGSPKNLELLKSHCFVVYLKVSVETQLIRTNGDISRPLINTMDRKQTLMQLQQKREAIYLEIADRAIDVNFNAPEQIAKSIKQLSQFI